MGLAASVYRNTCHRVARGQGRQRGRGRAPEGRRQRHGQAGPPRRWGLQDSSQHLTGRLQSRGIGLRSWLAASLRLSFLICKTGKALILSLGCRAWGSQIQKRPEETGSSPPGADGQARPPGKGRPWALGCSERWEACCTSSPGSGSLPLGDRVALATTAQEEQLALGWAVSRASRLWSGGRDCFGGRARGFLPLPWTFRFSPSVPEPPGQWDGPEPKAHV